MKTPRRALALALLAPAFALGACGGNSDSDDIKDIISQVDKDSAAICDHATDKLLAQVGGTAEQCKEAARGYADQADDSKIEGDVDVKVDGDKATAEFDTSDGNHHTVTLVKQDGDWKVDGDKTS